MKILGIGVDMVDNNRIRSSIKNKRFKVIRTFIVKKKFQVQKNL